MKKKLLPIIFEKRNKLKEKNDAVLQKRGISAIN